MSDSVRINKFLSEAGFCSRREADKLIDAGAVKINGKVPERGTKVNKGDMVTVHGQEVGRKQEERIYIAFNKPIGMSTSPVISFPRIFDENNDSRSVIGFGSWRRREQMLHCLLYGVSA